MEPADPVALVAHAHGEDRHVQVVLLVAGVDPPHVQELLDAQAEVLRVVLEEVLHQQSDDIQSFLLQTSILNRLSGELCQAITGNDESQLILEELERANLFVIPLDDQRQWFRYHHLFADLLRQRLQTLQSACIVDLHRRASAWCEGNGLLAQAIEHLLG